MIPPARPTFACAIAVLLGLAALGLPACSPGPDGGSDPAVEAPKTLPTALAAYDALRKELYAGRFIASYDACSRRYREKKFPADLFRKEVASNPGLQALGLTAEKVARLEPRELVDTYFRLLSEVVRKRIIVTLSETKVLGQSSLPDGRAAVTIETGGAPSRLLWVMEDGVWKMDGEEKGEGGGK